VVRNRAKERRLHEQVCERDGERCCDCGKHTLEIHHIISRRYKGAWDIRNLLCLCPDCHRGNNDAHTHTRRLQHIKYLHERFGYDYGEMGELWQQLWHELDKD